MRKYYIETYTIDDEWKQSNPRKYESEDYMESFMADALNSLRQPGYESKQIVRVGANFVTVMYSGGN